MAAVRWEEGVVTLQVKVQPRASRVGVVGLLGERVRIALTAPPVEGAANEALIRFLSGELGVAKGKVILLAGASSREKSLKVEGVSRETYQGFCGKWGLAGTA